MPMMVKARNSCTGGQSLIGAGREERPSSVVDRSAAAVERVDLRRVDPDELPVLDLQVGEARGGDLGADVDGGLDPVAVPARDALDRLEQGRPCEVGPHL